MVVGIVILFVLMLGNEDYRDALRFLIVPNSTTEIGFGIVIKTGLMVTLYVTIISYVTALILGLIVGIMRVSKNPILFHLSTLYVELMRGFPVLALVLWIGFVIAPLIRSATGGAVDLSSIQGAILGLSLGYAAYLAEVYRSGIESIPRGQMEAARSLGMGYTQAMRYVILPQAIRRVVPPLANDFVAMLKDSSLVSVLAVAELLQSSRLYVSRTFQAYPGYNSMALVYLALTLLFILVVRFIEKRWQGGS
jgi:polar amino acid transport system permease protein